eukprot:3704331-Rhodomonas_salina.1
MSGTDMPYGALCLCAPYAISGIDIPYGTTRGRGTRWCSPRSRPLSPYAPATPCPVLTRRAVLT